MEPVWSQLFCPLQVLEVSFRLVASRLNREVHCCARHLMTPISISPQSLLDTSWDSLCGVKISPYEAARELGFKLQWEGSAAESGEEGGTLLSECAHGLARNQELLWLTGIVSHRWYLWVELSKTTNEDG